MSSPTTSNLVGIAGASADLIFAVAEIGTILRFDGTTWIVVLTSSNGSFTGVWMASPTLRYAIGTDGLLKFNGTMWASDPNYVNVNGVLRAVWGSSPTNVVIVGDVGFMSRFDGIAWNTVTRRTGERFTLVTGSGSTAFAFGMNTTVRQTGSSSELLTSAPELKGVWAVDANTMFAVGNDGAI